MAEINRTVALNMAPIGSRMIGSKISEELILIIDHSMINVFVNIDKYKPVESIDKERIHKIRLHRIEIEELYIMVKSTKVHI